MSGVEQGGPADEGVVVRLESAGTPPKRRRGMEEGCASSSRKRRKSVETIFVPDFVARKRVLARAYRLR
jgi:hypothetical protein